MSSTASWRTFASAMPGAASPAAAPRRAPRTRAAMPTISGHRPGQELGSSKPSAPARVVATQRRPRHRRAGRAARCGSSHGCRVRSKSNSRPLPSRKAGRMTQVSDLNVFWMASNRDGSAPFPIATQRRVRRIQRPAHVLRGTRRQPQHHHALPPLHRRPGNYGRCSRSTTCRRRDVLARSKSETKDRSNRGSEHYRIQTRRSDAVSPGRSGTVHPRLVRSAHHPEPSANRSLRIDAR